MQESTVFCQIAAFAYYLLIGSSFMCINVCQVDRSITSLKGS